VCELNCLVSELLSRAIYRIIKPVPLLAAFLAEGFVSFHGTFPPPPEILNFARRLLALGLVGSSGARSSMRIGSFQSKADHAFEFGKLNLAAPVYVVLVEQYLDFFVAQTQPHHLESIFELASVQESASVHVELVEGRSDRQSQFSSR